jgi:hypothetical protein
MSQHDLDIANQLFPATRTDLNNALKALGSTSSGTSVPSTVYANQLWMDTSANTLYIRNEDNDANITIMVLDQTNDTVEYFKSDSIRTGLIEFTDGTDCITLNGSGNATVSGICTATTFSGSGSSLTGVTLKTSNTGSSNIPVGTTAQRDGSPSAGMLRFNSTTGGFEGYDGSAWGSIGGGASAGGSIYENSNSISADYTLTTNTNGMSVSPLTIASGVSVTVPSGSRWVIL